MTGNKHRARPATLTHDLAKAAVSIERREVIWDDWSNLSRYTFSYTAPNGAQGVAVAEVSDHGDGVAMLPFDAERRTAILIRQVRLPAILNGEAAPLWEVCAGLIDPGEAPEETALRELKEESGLALQRLECLGAVFTCPGTLTERLHLYLGSYTPADRQAPGGGAEADEEIEVHELPLSEIARMLEAGEIKDAKTALLLRMLQLRRPELFA